MEIKLRPEPKPFCKYGEFKGHKTLSMGTDESKSWGSLNFGKAKARLIVANMKEIQKFAEEQ